MEAPAHHELEILHRLEENPDTTQADLATQLGVAVGSVNWYIKRLVTKGYIKVTRMQKRRLRYLLTPEGIAEKTRLTASFVQATFKWYRITRQTATQWIEKIQHAGYDTVSIDGDGDLGEVVYLTCIEKHIHIATEFTPHCPRFRFEGLHLVVDWPTGKVPDDNNQQEHTHGIQ